MNVFIQGLIEVFSKFPGVGKKTAGRFIFYLIKLPQEQLNKMISDLAELSKIKICQNCFYPVFKDNGPLCEFCSNKSRSQNLICVVEKESDLLAIENTRRYKGLYHILGGTILSFNEGESKKEIRVKELIERVKNLQTKFKEMEIVLALRPDTAGDATNLYLEKVLKSLDVKITRLARGLPTGADLEYADEITLSEALIKRN